MRVASFLPSLSTLRSLRQASSRAANYCRPDPHLLANTCPAQRALLSSAVSVLGQAWRIRPPEVFPPDLGTTRLAPRINHLLVRLTSKVQSCYCAWPCLPSALCRALDSENTCKVSAKLSWPGCLSTVHSCHYLGSDEDRVSWWQFIKPCDGFNRSLDQGNGSEVTFLRLFKVLRLCRLEDHQKIQD